MLAAAEDGRRDLLPSDVPLRRKLQGLLLFRLLMAIFILVLTILVQSRRTGEDLLGHHLDLLCMFSSILFAFTAVAAVSLKYRISRLIRFAYLQLFFDVAAVTVLVYFSGGVDSLLSVLYMPVIISAALMLSRRGSLWIASVCTLAYGSLLDLQFFGFISPIQMVDEATGRGDSGSYLHCILTNCAAFYLVAFLSGYLAEALHKSSEELRKREKDLSQLEALHQNIVQSISSGLLTADIEGRIYLFNRSVQEILGLPADRIEGRNLSEVIPGLAIARPHPTGVPETNSREPHSRMEVSYSHPRGQKLRLGYSISRLETETGEPHGWIVTFQDLTQMKKLEDDMLRMEHLAFAGRVAAEIAHEIKNPLAAMSGSVQMLQAEAASNPLQTRLLSILLREIQRIDALVKDFLWLSKGVQKPERKEPVAVCAIMDEILPLLAARKISSRSHTVRAEYVCEPVVMMDSHQFRQIVWNLLENAIEAMPGGGSLTVRIGLAGEGDDAKARIDIEDTGPGVPEEMRDKIFEPFLTTKEMGAGLGLSIVYQLAANAGGRVEVSRSPSGGAVFTLFFPISSVQPLAKHS